MQPCNKGVRCQESLLHSSHAGQYKLQPKVMAAAQPRKLFKRILNEVAEAHLNRLGPYSYS